MTEQKYIEGLGRRKSAVARVRIVPSSKTSLLINGKQIHEYFPLKEHQHTIKEPLLKNADNNFTISVKVLGGGVSSQAGAIRHGIARALVLKNPEDRSVMKHAGFLKRDPRAKERKKFGLKKARKAPQWSKR